MTSHSDTRAGDGRKVLITGASGFLGGHLVDLFRRKGYEPRAFVRHTSRTESLEQQGVPIVRGDMKERRSLRVAVRGIDLVVHAASTMAGAPQEYDRATVQGTRDLLEFARRAGVRKFVYVSSIAVHSISAPRNGAVVTEESPYESDPRFLNKYVESRMRAEQAALDAASRGDVEVVVIRPGIMYGPGGKWPLVRIGYPVGRNCYVVVGSGRNPLPVCYVRNCADAILRALETPGISGECFNIVDDESFTAREYLRRLKEEVRPRFKVIRFPYLLARCIAGVGELAGVMLHLPCPIRTSHLVGCRKKLIYSNQKARKLLGWSPGKSKDAALAETMRSYAERERLTRRARIDVLGRPADKTRPLRACLVGCGMIGREHLKILRRTPNARVLAVCDRDREAAVELARQFDVPRTYPDAARMLESEEADVLHVLTPPQSHAELTELAVRHGCNVLVEKPMAVDAADARRMADAAARRGVQLCVDHNKLYDPVVIEARKLVESGDVGDVIWVESYCGFDLGSNPGSRYMLPGGARHWTFDIPGGLYQNLAPHPLGLALELLGDAELTHACARSGRVLPHQPTDELRMVLEGPAACGLVTVSIAGSPRLEYLTIFGTKMVLHVDLLNQWVVTQKVIRGLPKPISRAVTNLQHGWTVLRGTLGGMVRVFTGRWTPYEGMNLLIREFYSALQQGRKPPVGAEEGIQVMELMDRTWELLGPEALRRAEAGSRARVSTGLGTRGAVPGADGR